MTTLSAAQPVTILVRRRVRVEREPEFETALRGFIDFALSAPGNLGIHVLRPATTGSGPREYTVIDRFANRTDREAFKASPAYQQWMDRLRALTEAEPELEELGGLAGWFTLPAEPQVAPPSRVRMAAVTFLGVFPLTSILPPAGARLLPGWHALVVNALVTALIVITLTWIAMPALVWVFRPWLFGKAS